MYLIYLFTFFTYCKKNYFFCLSKNIDEKTLKIKKKKKYFCKNKEDLLDILETEVL